MNHARRALILPWWMWACFAIALLLTPLYGCAERYLSKEQDDEMRTLCEQQGGCAVVPTPLWRQIERMLGIGGA